MRDLLNVFADVGVMQARSSTRGTIWGLPQERIRFVDVATVDGRQPLTEVRCHLCAHRYYTRPDNVERWVGRPCLRLRCTGTYAISKVLESNFYRSLYRSGKIRRVVAAEHTGLLTSSQREKIESSFKTGGTPRCPERSRGNTDS